MNIFEKLKIKASLGDIDLEMTPVDTYGLFECRGDMQRVKSKKERYYYFYIDNWRLPTIEEALSLLGQEKAKHGLHIHPCFTGKQGYVFTADRRKPGGFWFVDLRQARVYWASGTMAGGFARLCRTPDLINPKS